MEIGKKGLISTIYRPEPGCSKVGEIQLGFGKFGLHLSEIRTRFKTKY